MRFTFGVALAAAAMAVGAGTVQAQNAKSKVIDTESLVIKPIEATTNFAGKTLNFVSRVTSETIDNNALIRTVNNLFGNTKKNAPTQGGLSPLPDPSTYPSTYYKSPIQPAMPKYQTLPNRR